MSKWQKINKTEAKNLLNKVLFKTFFHEIKWHDFLEKEFKWLKFEYWLYKDELLLIFGRVGEKLISLPFCEYGGPLPLKKEFNLKEFNKDVLERFRDIKIKLHPKILKSESQDPSSESHTNTHWLELKDKTENTVFSSFRKTLRHSIKKAREKNLSVKKCENESELKKFYNLYSANLKRKKTVPYPYSVFKFLFEQPETEILLGIYKNKIVAGDLFLHYTPSASSGQVNFVHYFFSAVDYKYRNFGASYLILWEKIRSLVDKNIIFDFGAAPKNSALEIFKKGWRGKEYPIFQIGIKRNEELLRSSKIRNIYGLLPNCLIKKLSPYLIKYRL